MVKKEVQEIVRVFSQIGDEISKRIIGMEDVKEGVMITAFAGEDSHLLLEGVPGVGKTELLKAFSRAVNIDFSRIQFKNDLKPKDIVGYLNLQGEFVKGPLFTNLLLADEINRASPKAQSGLLDAMAEGQITTEETGTHVLPQPYIVMATQNPIESHGGTQPLPEAQQDRFLKKVGVEYPTTEEAIEISRLNTRPKSELEPINPVINGDEIIEIRNTIKEIVHVSPRIDLLAVRMAELTRPENFELAHELKAKVGASPRGHISLIKAGRVKAVMNGRDYIIPKDLIDLAFPVFFTRVFFTRKNKSEISGTLKELIDGIIKEVYREGLLDE